MPGGRFETKGGDGECRPVRTRGRSQNCKQEAHVFSRAVLTCYLSSPVSVKKAQSKWCHRLPQPVGESHERVRVTLVSGDALRGAQRR